MLVVKTARVHNSDCQNSDCIKTAKTHTAETTHEDYTKNNEDYTQNSEDYTLKTLLLQSLL